jgi:hypothetical protein
MRTYEELLLVAVSVGSLLVGTVAGVPIVSDGFENYTIGQINAANSGNGTEGWPSPWNGVSDPTNMHFEALTRSPASGAMHAQLFGLNSPGVSRHFGDYGKPGSGVAHELSALSHQLEIKAENKAYWGNDFNQYVRWDNTAAVHVEFRTTGEIRCRGGGDPVVGRWDGQVYNGNPLYPSGLTLPDAQSGYVTLREEINLVNETYDLYYEDILLIANKGFRNLTGGKLNHVAFLQPKTSLAPVPNDPNAGGVLIDDILIMPEPATLGLFALVGLLGVRRGRSSFRRARG